ncbi:hypothetical protein [Subtercola sp. YIM 133946]|uniref:hypothetical protein n=1 Tax=Subtercola sp. YIM 133946 TaxID=3118909 RepID=UPI002F929292
MSSPNWVEVLVGIVWIAIMALLIRFRHQYVDRTKNQMEVMYGRLGRRMARQMTPAFVIVFACVAMLFGIGIITDGLFHWTVYTGAVHSR